MVVYVRAFVCECVCVCVCGGGGGMVGRGGVRGGACVCVCLADS